MRSRILLASAFSILIAVSTHSAAPPIDQALFQRYDTNHDGILDEQELERYVREQISPYNDPELRELEKGDPLLNAWAEKHIAEEAKKIANYGPLLEHGQPIKVGRVKPINFEKYYYKANPDQKTANSRDVLTKLAGLNFKLRKSSDLFLKPAESSEALPAQFSWTKVNGQPSVFTVDGAMTYRILPTGNNLNFRNFGITYEVDPTVEAHTSTAKTNQQDSISFKSPIQLLLDPALNNPNMDTLAIQSIYLTIGPLFETDLHRQTDTFGGDIFLSPSMPKIAIGAPWPPPNTISDPWLRWRPYIGFEAAGVDQIANPTPGIKLPNDYARFVLKLHVQLHIFRNFDIAADYNYRAFLFGPDGGFSFAEISPILYLDEDQHFSLGLTYKIGRTTPDFRYVNSLNAFLGVKF